jgi:hypothetical protein
LIRSFARVAPIDPSALKTMYDRKNYPAMLGWMKDSMRLDLQVGLRIVDDRPKTSPQCGLKYLSQCRLSAQPNLSRLA